MPTLLISDLGHFQVPGTQPSYDEGPAGRGGYVPEPATAATWPAASYGAPMASNNWGWQQQQQNNNNARPWYNIN
jgi:hypothetical protein